MRFGGCVFFTQSLPRDIRPRATLIVREVSLPVRTSLFVAIQAMQQLGFVEVGVGVVGVRVQRDVEGIQSGLRLIQLGRDATELRPSFEVILIEFDGDVKTFERGGEIARSVQRFGEMEMRFGIRRLVEQGQTKGFDRVGHAVFFQ